MATVAPCSVAVATVAPMTTMEIVSDSASARDLESRISGIQMDVDS